MLVFALCIRNVLYESIYIFPSPLFYLYQTSGFALALGNLVHGLSVCGHGKAEDLGNRLLPNWIKVVLAEVRVTCILLNNLKEKWLIDWVPYRNC